MAAPAGVRGRLDGAEGEAVCRFVEATGRRGAIGTTLEEIPQLLAGTGGTQIDARVADVELRPALAPDMPRGEGEL